MKHILFIVLSIGFLGCSGEQMAHSITKTQIAMSGNKPPASFEFANLETMRDYVFQTDDFSFSLPSAKQKDYNVMRGWVGENMRDGRTIAMGLKNTIAYQIVLSTSGNVSNYTEKNRELESGTRKYKPQRITSDGRILNINTHTEYHGQEKYACVVSENEIPFQERIKKKKFYRCYKFNPSRTKAKSVTVSLTYNKSSVKGYTYQDLQKRAKRTLDSLYIKDGWDK